MEVSAPLVLTPAMDTIISELLYTSQSFLHLTSVRVILTLPSVLILRFPDAHVARNSTVKYIHVI
jgi:hypothetical protein